MEITLSLVTDLIAEQFPQWAHLPIRPVALSGWDNRTFRLGEEMSIRLPSAEMYAAKVALEQKWLPRLAPHLSISIPKPLAMGKPSKDYPWHWSVYRWLEGESANSLSTDDIDLPLLASDLARFLHELHKIDTAGGPVPGSHNFYRGASVAVYDAQTRSAIVQLQDFINVNAVTAVWEKALSSTWDKSPVWIHGDVSAGNILIKDGRLAAVIDFGGMGVGDPACDLVIAWTFLTGESRELFRSAVSLDLDAPGRSSSVNDGGPGRRSLGEGDWARARGWALWKALITLAPLKDKASSDAMRQQRVIDEILHE